jgi:hypothetical protein
MRQAGRRDSDGGGNRGGKASARDSGDGAAAGACDRGPQHGSRSVGAGAGGRSSEGPSGRGPGSEGACRRDGRGGARCRCRCQAMLLLLYYSTLCSKSGVTYAKGLGPNSCRVHNQTP